MQRKTRFLVAVGLAMAAAGCSGLKDNLGLEKKAPDEFAVVRNAPLSLPPNFNLRPPKPGEIGEGRREQRDQARALLVRDRGGAASTAAAGVLATSRPPPGAGAAVAGGSGPSGVNYSFVAGRAEEPLAADIVKYRLLASAPGNPGAAMAGPARSATTDPGERALLGRLDAIDPDPDIRRKVDEEAARLAADDRTVVERMMFWRKLNPPGVVVEPKGEAARINENSALGKPPTEGETPEIRVERLSSGFSGIKLF